MSLSSPNKKRFEINMDSYEVLSATPTVLSVDLNEWIHFDQPGTYPITVGTSRVSGED